MDPQAQGEQVSTENSLDDRIADVFVPTDEAVEPAREASSEDSPEQAPQQESDETSPQFEEVEYDGETFQVPPKLKEAIIHKSDYTKKTQELAELRRNIEFREAQFKQQESSNQFGQFVKDDLSKLQTLDMQIQQYKGLDWATMSVEDITRFKLQLDNLKDQRAELDTQIRGKYGEFQQQQQKSLQELIEKGKEALKKSIPNWSDQTAREVAEYGRSLGFSADEMASVIDPRQVQVLYKAQQYDKLMSNKAQAAKQAQSAPPIVKPGSSNPMPAHVKAKLNAQKAIKTAKSPQERSRAVDARIGQIFGA